MKVVTIIGARPQFVKAATLSRAFSEEENIEELIIHTGQHFDPNMSQVFFDEMNIPKPTINLDIHGGTHGEMTSKMLFEIEKNLIDIKPDLLLVYGDTNSTLAGALAASKLHIPTAHVEAGLRSFNMKMPEEVNRILTDRISNFLFCPTQVAYDNLMKEGYNQMDCKIDIVGDVMLDAAMFYASRINDSNFKTKHNYDYILCTIHRAENTDDPIKLAIIIKALNEINKKTKVVLPLHPRTKQKIKEYNLKTNFEIIEPVGYLEMIAYLKNSRLVITDSGGLQKEAYFFEKKCVTLRDQTEWVELISEGVNTLCQINKRSIQEKVDSMLNKAVNFDSRLYGDGNAANKIVKIIKDIT